MKLTRFPGNPILEPHPGHPWEDLAVFNPGAWIADGRVWLLYRAAESGPEYKCYFGLAVSDDGCSFRKVSQHPVFSPSADGFDASTVQDPRVVKMGDYYYITYACRTYPYGQFWLPAAGCRGISARPSSQQDQHRTFDHARFQNLHPRRPHDRSVAG